MKKIIQILILVTVCIIYISCSNDENDNTVNNENFFNINVDNIWVYKYYSRSNSFPNMPNEFYPTNRIDSIRIIGQIELAGLIFSEKSTKKYSSDIFLSEELTYVRVNNQGHLIEINSDYPVDLITENSGFVLHPGLDFTYTYTYEQFLHSIVFKLHEQINVIVEDTSFNVMPYIGTATLIENDQNFDPKIIKVLYAANIGLIKHTMVEVTGNGSIEKRLIYHDLN